MDGIDAVAIKLMTMAKDGTLARAKPELLAFQNLTHFPPVLKPARRPYNAVQVAARHGHLDQVPADIFGQLTLRQQRDLREANQVALRRNEQIAKGDVPF